MQWTQAVEEHIQTLKPVSLTTELYQRIYSLVDLTSLNETDTEVSIIEFFKKATSPLGHVAAICVYPQFVRLAATQFSGTPIKVATVANFPEGNSSSEKILAEINQALTNGAQEIDIVFPYERYLAGEHQSARTLVSACKVACGLGVTLKVILETGALIEPVMIADACYDVIIAGADFVKTSTGKISQGATLEATTVMLLVVKHLRTQLKREIGVKISGGIREVQQAAQYIQLAEQIMGHDWVNPSSFRIGASKLVDELYHRR